MWHSSGTALAGSTKTAARFKRADSPIVIVSASTDATAATPLRAVERRLEFDIATNAIVASRPHPAIVGVRRRVAADEAVALSSRTVTCPTATAVGTIASASRRFFSDF